MARALGTSRKTFHKHQKFRLQIDVNDELACWRAIFRQPYKDRLGENVYMNIGREIHVFRQMQGI